MNLIPVGGPLDYKVYGSQIAFTSRATEFIIASDTTQIEEILIISPSEGHSSCDVNSKLIEGNISIEFQPEEIGIHEIRILSERNNRDVFNTFNLNVYDSSKLKINFTEEEAIVGKTFKFSVYCEDIGEGTLNVTIEQDERQLKPYVKQLPNESIPADLSNYYYYYEICFVPEIESSCRVQIEFIDNTDKIVYGDMFKLDAKSHDFIILPFPLAPFALDKRSSFNLKCIKDDVKDIKLEIKTQSGQIIESNLIKIEQNYYEIKFLPKSIERHFVDIYYDNELVNKDRIIKIDVFDVNNIRVKIPSAITLGEMNTFLVDTTDAGEGNLEVIIKDGYDTLKAQLLKRDKRKFIIGFSCDRNMKHEIHVIFNDIPIKDSPFFVSPDMVCSKSLEMLSEDLSSMSDQPMSTEYKAVEGGPLDGIQCGEKMWIIFDTQTPPYYDVQFLVIDENNMAVKHTKIQEEGGRWCIEFIPLSMGVHLIQRVITTDDKPKVHLLHKINVLNYSSHRIVYGYKLYNIQDPVQLVFDSANFDVNEIVPEIKNHNGEECELNECKYLTDYLALKFNPESPGGYIVNFFDKKNGQPLASSPYKIIVHENLKEIVKSSGIYDVTRLTILSNYLPEDFDFNKIRIEVYDPNDLRMKSCHFQNDKLNLIVEFITRIEGIHKVFLYLGQRLIYDNPFLIFINGDCYTASALSGILSPFHNFNTSTISFTNPRINPALNSSDSSNESNSLSRNAPLNLGFYQASSYGHGSIYCLKINKPFHFVISDQNLKGLSVFDSLNEPIDYQLNEDIHQNSSIIITPKIEGTHRILGLVEGREIEVQLFVLNNHVYESLFEMDNYNETENIIEKPFIIRLKEQNLEVDAYDPLGERVDVRYSTDNLASFVPHTTGYFRIYISDYHGPILGSPFYVLIYASKDESINENDYVESSGIRDCIRNEETTFVLRDIDPNIDVQIKSPNNDILLIKKVRDEKNFLRVSYTPELIGPHEILILKNTTKAIGSPITVYVSDPSLVKINNLHFKTKINETFSFDIDAIEAGEGFIRVNIKDSKMNDVLPEIIEFDDRKYLVQIMPTNPGVYVFSLTFNKYHIIESPFKVFITEQEDQNDSYSTQNLVDSRLILKQSSSSVEEISKSASQNRTDSISSAKEYDIDYFEQRKQKRKSKVNTMEVVSDANDHNRLTPIMDTSEDSSSDEPVYRGEGYIEKVEKLHDGTSNLLLHIGNDSDLSSASDANTIKGKYKYRLKRISGSHDAYSAYDQNKETSGPKAKQSKLNKSDSTDNSQLLRTKSKDLADTSLDKTNNNKDKTSRLADSLPSVSEKKKLFENGSASMNGSSKKNDVSTNNNSNNNSNNNNNNNNNSNKTNKVQDLVKQLNKTDNKSDDLKSKPEPNQSTKKLKKDQAAPNENNNNNNNSNNKQKQNNNNKNDLNKNNANANYSNNNNNNNKQKNELKQAQQNNDDDDDDDSNEIEEEDEINVVNENIVTKITKENQKKVDSKKTVVVEEKFVISPKENGESAQVGTAPPQLPPPAPTSATNSPQTKSKSGARSRSKSKQKDPGEPRNEISKIKSNKDHHLVEREEKSKSFIDRVTRITTDKSGKDKPSEKEILAKRVHIEPNLISTESLKEIGDEKIIEQFKPEETIQYEYEQVIEQPDSSQSSQLPSTRSNKPKKGSNKNSKKVENIETKTTQSETKEKFKKIEPVGEDKIKTTTTDLTTYITEEIEDKLTETLENTKDIHEFSYLQRKNKKHPNDSVDDLETNMHNLIQTIEPNDSLDEKDNQANNIATVKITATREFEFSHQPIYDQSSDSNSSIPRVSSSQSGENAESGSRAGSSNESGSEEHGIVKATIERRRTTIKPFDTDLNAAKSYNHSGSGENLFEYYKLSKSSTDKPDNTKKLILKPIDIDIMEHGEDFKAYETISSDDSLNKNITHKTSQVTQNKEELNENEDSANDETIAESDYDGEPKSLESLLRIKDTKLSPGMSLASAPAHFASITVRNNLVDEIVMNKNKSSESENNNESSNNEAGDDSGNEKTIDKYYYQPIERMTVEDFFDGSNPNSIKTDTTNQGKQSSVITGQQKSSLDELKAKFERKDSQSDEHLKRAKPEDQKSFNLKDGKSIPAKLPKSKVEIYDSQKPESSNNESDSKKNNKNKFANKKPSNDDKLVESNVIAKPDRSKLVSRTAPADKPKEKEYNEIEDKRSKLRKTPHTYPIEDEPPSEGDKNTPKTVTNYPTTEETTNKHSSEDEFSIFKRPNKTATATATSTQQPISSVNENTDLAKVEKGVKSLLNVYEKKADNSSVTKSEKLPKLKSDENKESDNANVKKLPKSTVSLFDKKEEEKSSKKENEKKKQHPQQQQPQHQTQPVQIRSEFEPVTSSNQTNLLSKREDQVIGQENVKPSSFLKSLEKPIESDTNTKDEKQSKKVDEPKKLSKTKLEIYEPKTDEDLSISRNSNKPTNLIKSNQNQEDKSKRNELEKQSTDKITKSVTDVSSVKSSFEKTKEPSLDKLKKSERVDKTDKPLDHSKPEKSQKAIPSKSEETSYKSQTPSLISTNQPQIQTTSNVPFEETSETLTEETTPKSIRKLVNKYEPKPSHNQADDKGGEDKMSKKKAKLASQSTSSESSRNSDIKSSSSDVTLDKLKPSADDKSIKQLIGKYEPPLSTSKTNLKESEPKITTPTTPASTLSSDASYQSKYSDPSTLTENDIKTEKAIQKLVDIYAQRNGGNLNQFNNNDPLQPIYYDFSRSYYNYQPNLGIPTNYNTQTVVQPVYDYNTNQYEKVEQKQTGQKTPDYHLSEKTRQPLESIKEVESRSDHYDEFYEDQYFEEEDTEKDLENSKRDTNQVFSGFDNNNDQLNNSNLNNTILDVTKTDMSFTGLERPPSTNSIYKSNNSDLTAIVHINPNMNVNITKPPQIRFKEPKEYEIVGENSRKDASSTSDNKKQYERKETILKSSENKSLETKKSNKELAFTISQPKGNTKEENSYLSSNEYLSDLAKYTNTKTARNTTTEQNNPIEVQLEVEYKKPLEFTVTKTRDRQVVEYKSLAEFSDRQVIRFNYKTVVDFTIGVKNKPSTNTFNSDENIETLKAEIEVTVYGEFMFQIIRKDTRKPIEIKVFPKMNNTYRIQFQPSPVTSYILKALPVSN